jgi:DNA-binding CsgD family transcriptional regulator
MARLGPLLSPLLVGRDDLLDQAERRVSEAAAGRGRLVLLAGEAGIGKSRLMASVDRRARAVGFVSAAGHVAPQDADVPAASILDIARTMLRVKGLAPLGHAILERMRDAEDLTQGRRRALVHDLADIVATAADGLDAPLLLWFDDLQWTDEISLDVIDGLARRAMDRRLLVVAAYRTDEVAPGSLLRGWRSRLLAQRLAEEARLVPLTLEQTGQMAALIIGSPLPRETAQALYDRTDGIPLHVEELLGALDDDRRLDASAIRDSAVPDTLEDAILQRLGRLSPDAQAVARAGAVIGRCFVPDVLAGIMERPVAALDAPFRELLDHDVLQPYATPGLLDFRHQLLRDALYRTVPASELRRFHARAAEFGQRLEGASEAHASLHYERAGMRAEAYRSALAGARAARRVLAHREGLDLYRRAIDNMPDDLPLPERADILQEACDAAGAREAIEPWRRWATEAVRVADLLGDPIRRARNLMSLAALDRRASAPTDLRIARCREVLDTVAGLPDSPTVHEIRSDAHLLIAMAQVEARDLASAEGSVAACIAEARASGIPAELSQAVSIEALVRMLRGDLTGGRADIEAEARRALAAGEGDGAITAMRLGGDFLVASLDYRGAIAFIDDGIRLGDSIEQSYCPGILNADAAIIAWADGRWLDADGRAREVLALHGSARAPGIARLPLAFVAVGRGDLGGARRWTVEALEFAEQGGSPDLVVAARWAQAEAALIARDHAAAVAAVEAALAWAEDSDERAQLVPLVVTGARAFLAAGRPADAARWVDRIGALLAGTPWAALPGVDHARGLVATAEGSTGIARSSLERAVAGWDALPRTWEALWARLDLASVLIRTSRYSEAAALVADVLERAAALDSRPLQERAEELARQARGHVSDDAAWHPLTSRELEVARLIAAGLTNPAIAGELGIAPKTASAHVEHILAKLGVARRAEVAAWVASLGDRSAAPRMPFGAGVTARR